MPIEIVKSKCKDWQIQIQQVRAVVMSVLIAGNLASIKFGEMAINEY